MDRQPDVAVRTRNLTHDRIVEEGHIPIGDGDDRNLRAGWSDALDGRNRDPGVLLVLPVGDLVLGMGARQCQHFRRIESQIVVARMAEEDIGSDMILAQFGQGAPHRLDVFIAFRIVLRTHFLSPPNRMRRA